MDKKIVFMILIENCETQNLNLETANEDFEILS